MLSLIIKIFLQIKNIIYSPLSRLLKYKYLSKSDFKVKFIHEGGIEIKIPRVSNLEILFDYGLLVGRNLKFINRPLSEPLMRRIVYELYSKNYIDNTKSIIDIGSWIGDNSIVWAKLLKNQATVLAIDPSKNNQDYCKKLCEFNKIENINLINAVCSDESNQKLGFSGSIDHANFRKTYDQKFVLSKTLNSVVNEFSLNKEIGFMHIDVEGFEFQVLKGADLILSDQKPIIIFEQHITKEDVSSIFDYLKTFGYEVYMINEVLQGCDLDCRNFIALHKNKNFPKLKKLSLKDLSELGIKSATVGPILIKMN